MPQINWANVTSFGDVLAGANTSAGGYFWTAITFMVFVVIFITMSSIGWMASLLTASFVGLISSILLAYMGLVAWWVVGGFVGTIIFMIIYSIWSNPYD